MASNIGIIEAAMANSHPFKEKPFNFFGLPRELRDCVYDNLLRGRRTQSRRHTEGEFSFRVYAHDCARQRHLLVSRQFKTELQERACKISWLELRRTEPWPGRKLKLPLKLKVSYSELHFEIERSLHRDGSQEQVSHLANAAVHLVCLRYPPFDLNLYTTPTWLIEEYVRYIAEGLDLQLSEEARKFLQSLKI